VCVCVEECLSFVKFAVCVRVSFLLSFSGREYCESERVINLQECPLPIFEFLFFKFGFKNFFFISLLLLWLCQANKCV